MRVSIRDVSTATLGIMVAFFLSGCTRFTGLTPPADDRQIEARDKLSALKRSNAGIESFKGIGTIQYLENGKFQTVRAAWVGTVPDKIRIEALGASGQPVVRLATDGKWLYLNSFYPQRFYKRRSKKKLGKLLPVPITTDALISLLIGRAPVYDYHTLSMEPNNAAYGSLFELKGRWQGVTQKIYLDKTNTTVLKVEMFDLNGRLAYAAELDRRKTLSGFSIPFRLRLFNTEQLVFTLTVERCWVNITVETAVFTLTPP
jgi:outer membrane biogenesis lipoprotein LolB